MISKHKSLLLLGAVLAAGSLVLAGTGEFNPAPITNGFTGPTTDIARQIRDLTKLCVYLFVPFMILSWVLLLIAIVRFRDRPGAVPARWHENVPLEIAWTAIPTIILITACIPMFKLMKQMETIPKGDVTVEVTGHRFFWEYSYPEAGITISNEPLRVPVNKNIVLNCTSADVNHAWWVPSFGVKMDCMAGRINTTWFNCDTPGKYKGQCAELCGESHALMLIDAQVLPQEQYDQWVAAKLKEKEEKAKAAAALAGPSASKAAASTAATPEPAKK